MKRGRMAAMDALAVEAAASGQVRLLVVEDEIFIRMFVCDMLRDAGYDVVEAVNGDEAVDLLRAGVRVDLVLSDVRMPGATDGLALLAFIRQNLADLPVIITSGHLVPGNALAKGAAQFLAKPFRAEDALEIIEREVAKLK